MNAKRLSIFIVCIVTVTIFVAGSLYTYAKYFGNDSNQYNQTSSNFYFKSRLIDRVPNASFYGGGTQVYSLDVRNHADSLRITPSNISYDVSISATNSYTGYSIKKNDVDVTSGSLVGTVANVDSLTITLPAGYIDGTVVTVTLSATAPYTKTLTQTITLHTGAGATYSVIDSVNASFAELQILTVNAIATDTLNITWDNAELSVDMTNNAVISATQNKDANNKVNGLLLSAIAQNSAITIRFFKTDVSLDYSQATQNIALNAIDISGQVA